MWPVHTVAVALPGADAGQEAVPDVSVRLGHVEPALAVGVLIEQAQLDALGDFGEQAEVGSDAVVGGAADAAALAILAPDHPAAAGRPVTLPEPMAGPFHGDLCPLRSFPLMNISPRNVAVWEWEAWR